MDKAVKYNINVICLSIYSEHHPDYLVFLKNGNNHKNTKLVNLVIWYLFSVCNLLVNSRQINKTVILKMILILKQTCFFKVYI